MMDVWKIIWLWKECVKVGNWNKKFRYEWYEWDRVTGQSAAALAFWMVRNGLCPYRPQVEMYM